MGVRMRNSAIASWGPDELCFKLLENRRAWKTRRREVFGDISDEGLRQLLMLAYFVSQSVTEGRYPKVRLFVPPASGVPEVSQDPWQLARFVEPLAIVDTDSLRQFVPSAASHNLALELHERAIEGRKSELICVAVCSAHSKESATRSFSTSLWTRLVRPGLMIRIDGPGELRVSEGHCAWHLQAGKLFDLGSATVPPLPQWLDKAAQLSKANVGIETRLKNTIHFAWHEIVHLISEQRCGGCLVILPTTGLTGNKVEAEYDIRLKACTDGPCLGREIADFVQFCSTTETIANLDEFRGVSNRWLSELHRLCRTLTPSPKSLRSTAARCSMPLCS